ncbi:MAG: hypothetical protein R8G66_00080 [Cytophagales bacterium]|nr:hypothetical protein [Cytophagales bacterium]
MSFFQKLYNVVLSLDQLGNTLAGGDPDNTISSRLGHLNHYREDGPGLKRRPDVNGYWRLLEMIVDTTFEPIDGKGHCVEAFYSDAGERFEGKTGGWALVMVSILVILTCIPLLIIFRLARLLGVTQGDPDKKRPQKILNRLGLIEQRLQALVHELQDNELDPQQGTIEQLDQIVVKVGEVKKELK